MNNNCFVLRRLSKAPNRTGVLCACVPNGIIIFVYRKYRIACVCSLLYPPACAGGGEREGCGGVTELGMRARGS